MGVESQDGQHYKEKKTALIDERNWSAAMQRYANFDSPPRNQSPVELRLPESCHTRLFLSLPRTSKSSCLLYNLTSQVLSRTDFSYILYVQLRVWCLSHLSRQHPVCLQARAAEADLRWSRRRPVDYAPLLLLIVLSIEMQMQCFITAQTQSVTPWPLVTTQRRNGDYTATPSPLPDKPRRRAYFFVRKHAAAAT
jgi:hypothetical protein